MRVAGIIAFRGKFQIWLQGRTNIVLRHNTWLTRLAKEKIVQRAPSVRDAELVSAWEDAGKKTLKDAANASIATSAWQAEMMKIGNYQAHAQLCHNIPRAPEVENIKELPAAELAEGLPKNQCPWCGFIQQGSTSVHRKFCMNMPIRMWLARQRATSKSYNEDGNEEPLCHCGSENSEAHARARQEKQCGERFAALGLEKEQG